MPWLPPSHRESAAPLKFGWSRYNQLKKETNAHFIDDLTRHLVSINEPMFVPVMPQSCAILKCGKGPRGAPMMIRGVKDSIPVDSLFTISFPARSRMK